MDYKVVGNKKLKMGYTTGSCAAAAAKAACMMLLSGEKIVSVYLSTPSGTVLDLNIEDVKISENTVSCAVIKDGGDDPDITTGIKIYASVSKIQAGIEIDGGEGIGRVTKKGLAVEPGKAAINPVPLKMIKKEISQITEKYNYLGGIKVLISSPEALKIAHKTFNARLGIEGGISILGTSGIVEPMSMKALIDTIKAEMNVFRSSGKEILFMAPGNYGRNFALKNFGMDIDRAVKYSNYLGEALDYALYLGFKKILICSHMGKIVKTAGGIMDTHSKTADCRMEILAAHCAVNGGSIETVKKIFQCVTTDEALEIMDLECGLTKKVSESIRERIKYHIDYRTGRKIQTEFIVFASNNRIFTMSEFAEALICQIKEG